MQWDGTPLANVTAADLDRRHRFDLYLSATRFRVVERGTLIKDAAFPAGVTLPFGTASVYLMHEVYHTGADRHEIQGDTNNAYWYNYRPWCDERHWDNMGFEVLSALPP